MTFPQSVIGGQQKNYARSKQKGSRDSNNHTEITV